MPNIRPLPPGLQKIAIEELNEVPERIEADLEAMKAWIAKQPHLTARTDDQFLVAFLRGSKYSLEKAKQKLDRYYTLKAALPELFDKMDVNDPTTRELIRLGVAFKLPIPLGEDGPRIAISRAGLHDPQRVTFPELIKINVLMGIIQLLEDDNAIISGVIEILDMADVTRAHFFQLNPSFMRKISIMGEEALPLRQKGTHFINVPSGFETVFNAVRSVLMEKTKSRLRVHGSNLESLYEHVPKKCLPIEYGGENGSMEEIIDYWEKKLLSYRDYFLEEEKYRTDESRRLGAPFNYESLFGMEGSFRKLDVD